MHCVQTSELADPPSIVNLRSGQRLRCVSGAAMVSSDARSGRKTNSILLEGESHTPSGRRTVTVQPLLGRCSFVVEPR